MTCISRALCALTFFLLNVSALQADFTVSGRRLLKDGQPFTIKGVCYNPTPIGDNGSRSPNGDYFTSNYAALWDRDLPQLRAMGANVIRIYGWNPTADHTEFLNRCYNNGDRPLYVLVNYWVDPATDWTNSRSIRNITNNFTNIENRLGSHPAVLGLIVGNEVNAQNGNGGKPAFWSAMNAVAGSIKALNSKRLLSIAITDALDQMGANDGVMTNIDFWCMQLYRGGSFGSFFSDFAARSGRPVVISEYGFDALNHAANAPYPNNAEFSGDTVVNLWLEIARAFEVCAGGCVFEFCDEWFRAPGTDGTQDPGGWYAPGFADGYADEEWWGLFSIAKNGSGPDKHTARAAFHEFSALWNPLVQPPQPPVNPNPSAFDGTFEAVSVGTNTFGAFVYGPTMNGWSFAGNAGLAGNNSGFTSGNPAAPQGTQVGFVQMQGSISAQISLAAGTYTLSAYTANRANWGAAQTVAVFIDGVEVGRFTGGTAYAAATTRSFVVAAGTHEIRFAGLSAIDATLFIDAVMVQPASATTVAVSGAGFETPDVGANNFYSFAYGPAVVAGVQPWKFEGAAGVTGNNSGFSSANPGAPEGKQVAFVQINTGAISQSVSFPSSSTYRLSVSAAHRGIWNQGRQVVQVYLDSALIGTVTATGTAYERIAFDFSAGAGAHVLSFRGTATDDSTLFLDDVAISVVGQ
jgi:hypothetical protein